MESQRTIKLTTLLADAASHLSDLARWPESEATRETCTNTIKTLRKAFKEDSYPRAFLYLSACHLAHEIYGNLDARQGDPKTAGLKAAWLKLAELFD